MHNSTLDSYMPSNTSWLNDSDPIASISGPEETFNGARRMAVAKHLAMACIELAEAHQESFDLAETYRQAEARHRALADLEGIGNDGCVLNALPVLKATPEQELTLVDLLGFTWGWANVPDRQIHRDLVEAAKELLEGLAWRLPTPCQARTTVPVARHNGQPRN